MVSVVFIAALLNGCVVIGGMMDSILFDDQNGEFFQKMGRELDKEQFTSDDEKFSKRKAAERNCQYLEQPQEECLKAQKLTLDINLRKLPRL